MRSQEIASPEGHAVSPGARQKLLGAAIELFTARGYAATSVREIVEHAGLTKPALYYHFGSKEAIYLEILRDVHLRMEEALSRLKSQEGASRERLTGFAVGLYHLFEANVSTARFMNGILWGPPQGAPPFDFRTFHDAIRAAIQPMIEDGIARGELGAADPFDVAQALIGALSFSIDVHLVHPEWGTGIAGLRRVLDLLFQGLARPASQEAIR